MPGFGETDEIQALHRENAELRRRCLRATAERDNLAMWMLYRISNRELQDEEERRGFIQKVLETMQSGRPVPHLREPILPEFVSALAEHDRQSDAAEHERSPP